MSSASFDILDYGVLAVMLVLCTFVGCYFGCCGSKIKSVADFINGSGKLKTVPVAISLIARYAIIYHLRSSVKVKRFFLLLPLASQLSGVLIISVPGEIYVYGAIYSLTVLSMICAVLVINHLILPVFYENNIVNCFEVRHLFRIMILRDDSYSYHHIPYHISTWNCDSISD